MVAPRILREPATVGATTAITVDMNAIVNVADLDLTRSADMLELENRIETAATEICEELAREYPFGQPRTSVCISRAVDDAMSTAREIVANL